MSRIQQCVLCLACLSMAFLTLMSGCATTRPYEYESMEQTKVVCPEGTNPDPRITGVCESVCRDYNGEKWDMTTKGCISACNPGFSWDGSKCKSLCKGETTWDGLNSSCVCPEGKFPVEGGLCMTKEELQCERDKAMKAAVERAAVLKAQIEANRAAPPKPPRCKPGTDWDLFTQQCLSICQGGTWDDAQATCRCPQGQQWDLLHTHCEVPLLK